MAYGSYNQYDSRWGKKNYNGSSNMATAGCGPTSVANLVHNIDPSIDPWDVAKFMKSHGYAIYNQGTAHAGIPAALKHFGAKNVKEVNAMSNVWKNLSEGYVADFLMGSGSVGGITWTTSGHFIAIVGYKTKNGKHYVKVEDSGGRGHDGWYCYETQMKGKVRKIWTCLATPKNIKPLAKPTGKYSGTIPGPTLKYGSSGTNTIYLQKFLNWYGNFKLKVDGKFGDATEKALMVFQQTEGLLVDGIYGTNSAKAAKKYKKNTTTTATTTTITSVSSAIADSDLPKKCIDVSYWQGKISVDNWKKIKKTCGYAICRSSYTSQSKFALSPDSTFATNFKNAQAAGLKVGAYHYSQAITVAEAKKEAEYMCNILKDYKPDFYVVCDFEYGGRLSSKIGKAASDIANAFCDVVKSHGYSPCIYANTSTLNSNLTNPKYPVWVAQYNSTCTYKGSKAMWQYTSSGTIDGIEKKNTNNGTNKVDLSHVYSIPTVMANVTTAVDDTIESKPKTNEEKFIEALIALSWPVGTPKVKWDFDTGAPTTACKKAMIERGYKTEVQWSDCGYGVNTALYVALGKKITTLPGDPKTAFSKELTGCKLVWEGKKIPKNFLKPGMIVRYKKTTGSQHILAFLKTAKDSDGNDIDVIVEGGRNTRFFVQRKVAEKYNASNVRHSTIQVWQVV